MNTFRLSLCLLVSIFASSVGNAQNLATLVRDAQIESKSTENAAKRSDAAILKIQKARDEAISLAKAKADQKIADVVADLASKLEGELAKAVKANDPIRASQIRQLQEKILVDFKLPVPTRELRFLSYNIHHGQGRDGKIVLKRIGDITRSWPAGTSNCPREEKRIERRLRRRSKPKMAWSLRSFQRISIM